MTGKARRILFTGVGGTIGEGIRRHLEANGDEVIGLSHVKAPGAALVADFGDDAALAKAVGSVAAPISGIVMAHGILEPGPVDRVSPASWRRLMDVNVNSIYAIIHAALPKLTRGSGIVVISSTAAFDHSPVGGPHYTASKWALNGLVRHLAFDLGPRGIRINSILPGLVEGPMGHQLLTDEQYEGSLLEIPLRRAADASEIGDVAMFLLSEKSSYMTGANVPVSGGYR